MPKSPQIEDGFVKVANELHLAFMRLNIPQVDRRILDAIIYKTYGWNKKADHISYSQFQELTHISDLRHIHRSLKNLKNRNIITVCKNGSSTPLYSIQKDYDLWDTPVEATPDEATPVEMLPRQALPVNKKTTPVEA